MADVYKSWTVTMLDGKSCLLTLQTDATLWISLDNVVSQFDLPSFSQVQADIRAAWTELRQSQPCPATKLVPNTAVSLVCDLGFSHRSKFHHDPSTSVYWLTDAS